MEKNKGVVRSSKAVEVEEFKEEDVWDVMNEEASEKGLKNCESKQKITSKKSMYSVTRMIPVPQKHKNNKQQNEATHHYYNSAPVNVPDWSTIYYNNNDNNNNNNNAATRSTHDDDDDDVDFDDVGGRLPPHEWLARKFERNQISSFSVCEGVGRTLKGRDLSRVRNDVLSKTGFI